MLHAVIPFAYVFTNESQVFFFEDLNDFLKYVCVCIYINISFFVLFMCGTRIVSTWKLDLCVREYISICGFLFGQMGGRTDKVKWTQSLAKFYELIPIWI